MAQALPALRSYTTLRLRILLLDKNFDPKKLNFSLARNVARGIYREDLELLTGDKLAQIKGIPRARLRALYLKKMTPAVLRIYQAVIKGKQKQFPKQFWHGWQGKLNLIICFRYVLEEECGIVMQRKPRQIDPRLSRKKQKQFLRDTCNGGDWAIFMAQFKLQGAIQQTFRNSISKLMRASYPWAFNLRTPEGQHLHPDDFKYDRMWQGYKGTRLIRRMLDHRLGKHLGITMDKETQTFDSRLLRDNQGELLASLDQTCWRNVFIAEGMDGILSSRPEFQGKVGKILEWRYPWAFDWSKPEGEHLHHYDFEAKAVFTSDQELRTALLHEAAAAGWSIQALPKNISRDWLMNHGLGSLSSIPRIELFRRAFPNEFSHGVLAEIDFRNQTSTTSLRTTALRRIKKTKAGSTPYGIAHLKRVKYYFDRSLIGFAVRQESAEHGIIYRVHRIIQPDSEPGRQYSPVKAFYLVAGPKNYWRPRLLDYDPEKHPIISRTRKATLVDFGIAPHSLSIDQQKSVLKLGAFEFLRQNGFLQSRRKDRV